MLILGVDLTSAPSRRKPIAVCRAHLEAGELWVGSFDELRDFTAFETLLAAPGPWVAGMDFPFGQSRRLLRNLGWNGEWSDYVAHFAALGRDGFVQLLEDYKRERPSGDKEHRRETDRLAGSISPQKLYGVPVAKMFYEGARRLLDAGVRVPPLRENGDPRVVLEAYPALLARHLVGRASYKNDQVAKQTQLQRDTRRALVDGVLSADQDWPYGVRVRLDSALADELVEEPGADRLDALFCAIQAAWAVGRGKDLGIPADADPSEGWIVDPCMLPETGGSGREAVSPPEEVCEVLARGRDVWVERIVSTGQVSPPGFWYDQEVEEWVYLVSGAARLRFEDEGADRVLNAGDHLVIPAHARHRVSWTDPERETVWLAVFYPP